MTPAEREEYIAAAEKEAAAVESHVPGLKLLRSTHFRDAGSSRGYGGQCPWEAQGTIDGHPFYARLRGDRAAMSVWRLDQLNADRPIDTRNATWNLAVSWEESIWSAVIDNYTGTPYAGSVNTVDEVAELLNTLVEKLAPTHPDTNPNSSSLLRAAIERAIGSPSCAT